MTSKREKGVSCQTLAKAQGKGGKTKGWATEKSQTKSGAKDLWCKKGLLPKDVME